jgi:hypothetical protein
MAIAFVQKQIKTSTATPASTPAFASSVAVGDIIVVFGGIDGSTAGLMSGVTDSLGNTYTAVPSFFTSDAGNSVSFNCWWTRVTVGGASNVVSLAYNDTANSADIAVQHFNGFVGTATFDLKITTVTSGASTTATSGTSGTTANANEVIIGGAVHAGLASAYTLGSGYTNLSDSGGVGRQVGMESKVVAATGTQLAQFTIAAARPSIGGLVTFYDASTTPTGWQHPINQPSSHFRPISGSY